MTQPEGGNLNGENHCHYCEVALPTTSTLIDTLARHYCHACFVQLRHAEPPDAATVFRCSICGDSRTARDSFDRDGRIACGNCLSSTAPEASNGEQPAVADPETQSREIDKQLDVAIPDNLLSTITCPHCWHRFAPDKVLWVSQHAELLGDPIVGPEAQSRFRPSRFNALGEAIDARDMPCQLLACPRCHLIVPRPLVEHEPLFFSIIGSPASGKSHFLASMTWELRRCSVQVLPEFWRRRHRFQSAVERI